MVNHARHGLCLLLLGLMSTGCGTDYVPGETPARLRVLHRDITYTRSPLTLPARPDEPFELRARLQKPSSSRFVLDRVRWEWSLNGDPLDRVDSPVFSRTLSGTATRISVTAKAYWSVTRNGSNRRVLQTLERTVYPAIARKKKPGQTLLNGYRIGSYPDVSGTYSRLGSSLVVLKSGVRYYGSVGSHRPLGSLSKGSRVSPAGSPVPRRNNRVRLRVNNRDVWVSDTAVLLPPSVRYHPERYREPSWYYPVTETNQSGFTLPYLHWKQFDHDPDYRRREDPPYPHYIPLRHRLLEKLRGLQKALQARGHSPRIKLISGIRNPHYNLGEYRTGQSLKALYSRHQYGDAVDLIVDGSLNGRMDDLNDDGRVDVRDARVVGRITEAWERKHQRFGGIGVYGHHDVDRIPRTPYVHIDTRGFKARWTIP